MCPYVHDVTYMIIGGFYYFPEQTWDMVIEKVTMTGRERKRTINSEHLKEKEHQLRTSLTYAVSKHIKCEGKYPM